MELIRTEEVDGQPVEVYYDGEVVSRQEAKKKKVPRYFDPTTVCVRGHISERYVQSGACIACQKVRDQKKTPHVSHGKPTAVQYYRSILAVAPPRGYNVPTLVRVASELAGGQTFGEANCRQFCSKLKKDGMLSMNSFAIGGLKNYTTTEKFYEQYANEEQLYLKINPRYADKIEAAFVKHKQKARKKEDEEAEERMAQEAMASLAEYKMEHTPVALMGRAIVGYIKELEADKKYDEWMAKIDDLKQAVISLREKNKTLVAANIKASDKNNSLMRENHDLKSENSRMKAAIDALEQVIHSQTSVNFKLGEVEKIKKLLGPKFLQSLPSGATNASAKIDAQNGGR